MNERVERMLTSEKRQPDGALFELLVSLIWMRNGSETVELLQEAPPERRPDIRAIRGKKAWYIECKRLKKSSEYSESERQKWLQMWALMREALVRQRYSAVLDIVFHVELETLPDDFIVKELLEKLRLINPPCKVVSNEVWTVSAAPINYPAIKNHLSRYLVKYPSEQVVELIAGRRDPNRGFTSSIEGRFERLGGGNANNIFIDDISFAIGAFWSCDAERSIERKARDIRRHLVDAVDQLPEGETGAVHVGLETLDGQIVEAERYKRIVNSVLNFDTRGKDLRWVYCHLFQSYAPPNSAWIIDETVYHFNRLGCTEPSPIVEMSAIVPEDESDNDSALSAHWLKPTP